MLIVLLLQHRIDYLYVVFIVWNTPIEAMWVWFKTDPAGKTTPNEPFLGPFCLDLLSVGFPFSSA